MRGIFRLRPPKPRYDVTWDPRWVLDYLQNLPDVNLKTISKKLITLLALATGQRIQTLSLIKLSNINESLSGIRIVIPDFVKNSGPKRVQPCLDLPFFRGNEKLCVASLMRKYITFTSDLRQEKCDALFITSNKPHGAATKQTLSNWVKRTIEAAGVDVTMFTAHSTRHASTSAALRKGLSVDVITKTAGWSLSSTFAKFYNRPVSDGKRFLETVFA